MTTNSCAEDFPRVVISLDFELRWGVHDVRQQFERIPAESGGGEACSSGALTLFAERQIRTTWAAVGALACQSWDEYFERAPEPPRYANRALAVKREYADLDPDGELHFAPDLIDAIRATPGQELGTHTFSHLYLREPGITADDVAADLAAVSQLYGERYGATPKSLVFPRNQPAFIDVIRANGIKIWRGNPGPWYYDCEDTEHNGALARSFRLIDGINPLRRLAALLEQDMTRASLFLRLGLPSPLWHAHLQRITFVS